MYFCIQMSPTSAATVNDLGITIFLEKERWTLGRKVSLHFVTNSSSLFYETLSLFLSIHFPEMYLREKNAEHKTEVENKVCPNVQTYWDNIAQDSNSTFNIHYGELYRKSLYTDDGIIRKGFICHLKVWVLSKEELFFQTYSSTNCV